MFKFLKSKTVWGGILAALPSVTDAISAGLLGPKASDLLYGLGIVLGAVGIKSAISKRREF